MALVQLIFLVFIKIFCWWAVSYQKLCWVMPFLYMYIFLLIWETFLLSPTNTFFLRIYCISKWLHRTHFLTEYVNNFILLQTRKSSGSRVRHFLIPKSRNVKLLQIVYACAYLLARYFPGIEVYIIAKVYATSALLCPKKYICIKNIAYRANVWAYLPLVDARNTKTRVQLFT